MFLSVEVRHVLTICGDMASRKSDSGTSVPTTPSKWATLVCNHQTYVLTFYK